MYAFKDFMISQSMTKKLVIMSVVLYLAYAIKIDFEE